MSVNDLNKKNMQTEIANKICADYKVEVTHKKVGITCVA